MVEALPYKVLVIDSYQHLFVGTNKVYSSERISNGPVPAREISQSQGLLHSGDDGEIGL